MQHVCSTASSVGKISPLPTIYTVSLFRTLRVLKVSSIAFTYTTSRREALQSMTRANRNTSGTRSHKCPPDLVASGVYHRLRSEEGFYRRGLHPSTLGRPDIPTRTPPAKCFWRRLATSTIILSRRLIVPPSEYVDTDILSMYYDRR